MWYDKWYEDVTRLSLLLNETQNETGAAVVTSELDKRV